jgi:hypothetical protein
MSAMQILVLFVVIVLLAGLAAAGWFWWRRQELRRRFGPEYDRVVSEQDNRLAAERELRGRERRHAELELRPLSPSARQRYLEQWERIQAMFVDDPAAAVVSGDELVTRLVAERGYPTSDYDEQMSYLSVEHATTLGHYRDAHDIYLRNERGEASTEELRQALVHYRALFGELLESDAEPEESDLRTRSGADDDYRTDADTRTDARARIDGDTRMDEDTRMDADVDRARDSRTDEAEAESASARADQAAESMRPGRSGGAR